MDPVNPEGPLCCEIGPGRQWQVVVDHGLSLPALYPTLHFARSLLPQTGPAQRLCTTEIVWKHAEFAWPVPVCGAIVP